MFSAYKLALVLILCTSAWPAPLRVCADPNNLPFSNRQGEGFENELAQMVARDLGRAVQYVWIVRRGADLKALAAGACDVVMGTAAAEKVVPVTRPYYRSSYVFVTRRGTAIHSFDDPRMKQSRIGLEQLLGADDAAEPPARALAGRGLLSRVAWYRLQPNFIQPNQSAVLLDAMKRGEIDVAVAWGPVAGYYAHRDSAPVALTPVSPQAENAVPFAFDIAMAVRPGEENLLRNLNAYISRHRAQIDALLRNYGVPLVEAAVAGNR